jgi:hypothetical protein
VSEEIERLRAASAAAASARERLRLAHHEIARLAAALRAAEAIRRDHAGVGASAIILAAETERRAEAAEARVRQVESLAALVAKGDESVARMLLAAEAVRERARSDTVEECAKVAASFGAVWLRTQSSRVAQDIAAAIRALAPRADREGGR